MEKNNPFNPYSPLVWVKVLTLAALFVLSLILGFYLGTICC